METVVAALAKRFLIPLGLMATASATNTVIQKKIYVSSMTTLKITNKEMKYTMKITEYFQESGLLIKRVGETIQNKERSKKVDSSAC